LGGDGLLGAAQLPPSFAEVGQRRGLAAPVAEPAGDGGGVLARGDGLLGPARVEQGQAEVAERRALAVPVACLPEDGGGVPASSDGLLRPARWPQGNAEVVESDAFGRALTEAAGGIHADGCDSDRVVPLPPPH
jgi:hypothetical protein